MKLFTTFFRSTFYSALVLLALTLVGRPALAEQKQVFGDYEIHYIALPTTILDPEVATRYELPRSKSTGFVNISVLKKQEDGSMRAVSAFIRGKVNNPVQQSRSLDFRRINEGDALYQIAQFWYSQGEVLTFQLEIQADPNQGPFSLRFHQELFPQ
ncbi:conserved hypothetical protein [Hahella chejuensis KCTC 2396]|uniref:DUF4426 domain-containing protein n=1 Tax=Hahella chejuensis (strain KCTC 2396) TaxID=349521 RepID=Q2S8L8_HAHCH|nr:DUF4426 domain-containing protein [Hahella chejuensis]ABC33006.1 conserved hypothetical protein [Hahella chejuensis KCTC 2396]